VCVCVCECVCLCVFVCVCVCGCVCDCFPDLLNDAINRDSLKLYILLSRFLPSPFLQSSSFCGYLFLRPLFILCFQAPRCVEFRHCSEGLMQVIELHRVCQHCVRFYI
jgi:hypothetical protein